MDADTFDSLKHHIADLTIDQCASLLSKLTERTAQATATATATDIIEAAAASKLHCPRCQGTQMYRHGEANGLQRFRCRACGRTFNSLTGTPLARLRLKEK